MLWYGIDGYLVRTEKRTDFETYSYKTFRSGYIIKIALIRLQVHPHLDAYTNTRDSLTVWKSSYSLPWTIRHSWQANNSLARLYPALL